MAERIHKARSTHYAVTGDIGDRECLMIDKIAHVTHVNLACQIILDGRIQTRLVYDKSILNTKRIAAVWLSPNDWHNAGGFRYGSVRFMFDLRKLLAKKNIYWVEAMSYNPVACRILVTEHDHSKDKDLKSYNITEPCGPVWFNEDDDAYYWNSTYCLELIFEDELNISSLEYIDFVKHHKNRCCIAPESCRERGMLATQAAQRVLARLLSEEKTEINEALLRMPDGNVQISEYLRQTIRAVTTTPSKNSLLYANDRAADALARAVLANYARENLADQQMIAKLFHKGELAKALADLCEFHFDDEDILAYE